MIRLSAIVLCIAHTLVGYAQVKIDTTALLKKLDAIRVDLKIPAMTVALQQGDSLLFATGLGYADLEHQLRASPTTSFRIASITKTFTSTLLMQLVEQGQLDLETPISTYGIDLGNPRIRVKHLLTHTSEGEPGTHFQYNGYRYGLLGPIIETVTGKPFDQVLMATIVTPLAMRSTAPSISLYRYFSYTQQRKEMLPYFEQAFTHLARPYRLTDKGACVATHYLDEFGAFGGLASTVKDLLTYSKAIDEHQFVTAQTQAAIFRPNRTTNGAVTPYGLGWYTQSYHGLDFYWHYGQTQGESGLLVKVPARKLTFVVLANTDKLSQPFPLGDGDLFTSPIGQLLYKYCLNADHKLSLIEYQLPIATIREKLTRFKQSADNEFYNKELITQATLALIKGDTLRAKELYKLYASLNFDSAPVGSAGIEVAAIEQVGVNQSLSKEFTLVKPTQIRVYGVGENCSADFSSWCDYGWIESLSGKLIWQMQRQPTSGAGGAQKNQVVDQVIQLPAGKYRLRYKSDGGHAYNSWDSAPPIHFFWGLKLYKLSVQGNKSTKKAF